MTRREIKGLSDVARMSQKIEQTNKGTWLPIYFNFWEYEVTPFPERGGHLVTELIRPCTEEEIEEAVRRWMMM